MKIAFTEILESIYLVILIWSSILSLQVNLWVGIPAVLIVLACIYSQVHKFKRKRREWKDWTSKLN